MTSLLQHFRRRNVGMSSLLQDDGIHSLNYYSLRFLFEGLGHLMEHLLISNARYIQSANAYGVRKMLRNILALQQNIRTISAAIHIAEFERVKRYYDLFFMSPAVSA